MTPGIPFTLCFYFLRENFYYFYGQKTQQRTLSPALWPVLQPWPLPAWQCEPLTLPSQWQWVSSYLSLWLVQIASTSIARAPLSSQVTCVKATVIRSSCRLDAPAWPPPWWCSRDPHPLAQGRQEDDQLGGIHIVCGHSQLLSYSTRWWHCWLLRKGQVASCGATPFASSFFSHPGPTTSASSLALSLVCTCGPT